MTDVPHKCTLRPGPSEISRLLPVFQRCSASFLRENRFITALPQGPDSIELVEYS